VISIIYFFNATGPNFFNCAILTIQFFEQFWPPTFLIVQS